jgi:hypothetical protein
LDNIAVNEGRKSLTRTRTRYGHRLDGLVVALIAAADAAWTTCN